jgi:hypothetical protein
MRRRRRTRPERRPSASRKRASSLADCSNTISPLFAGRRTLYA